MCGCGPCSWSTVLTFGSGLWFLAYSSCWRRLWASLSPGWAASTLWKWTFFRPKLGIRTSQSLWSGWHCEFKKKKKKMATFIICMWTRMVGLMHVSPIANVFFDCQQGFAPFDITSKKHNILTQICVFFALVCFLLGWVGRITLSLSSVFAHPSAQVTHLVIKRPQFFHFKPGDYVYINIPVIAKYEWHPFTISSAPEQSGRPCSPTTSHPPNGLWGPL